MDTDPQSGAEWLIIELVMLFERTSRRTINRRMKPGADHFLVSEMRNGRRLINAHSMSIDAQRRWREWLLKESAEQNAAPPACADEGQGSFWLETETEKKTKALGLLPAQISVLMRRNRIVQPLVNHDYRALGYARKQDYARDIAGREGVAVRSIYRWTKVLRSGDPSDLAPELRGRRPGTGSALDASAKSFLVDRYLRKRLSVRQCYRALVNYLEVKQKSPGCRASHLYEVPCYATVARFLRGLDALDQAQREGPAKVKSVLGYIERERTEAAGDTWYMDEWRADGLFYLDWRQSQIVRPYILTLLDGRSRMVLGTRVVALGENETAKRKLSDAAAGLVEDAIGKYGAPLRFYSDKGGHFRGKLGSRYGEIAKEKLLEQTVSALDYLGIERVGPGREKNPRANPIERFHRIYADLARRDFAGSWCGANTDERQSTYGGDGVTAGVDLRVERHLKFFCTGRKDDDGNRVPTELFSFNHFAETLLPAWIDEYNHEPSEANGLSGLSPEAAWQRFGSAEKRAVSEHDLALAFAETFTNRSILPGGIVELPGEQRGLEQRYYSPELLLIAGQQRTVRRLRGDRSFIVVPRGDGSGQPIIARLKRRVTDGDSAALATEIENLARVGKIFRDTRAPEAMPLPAQPERTGLTARVEAQETLYANDIADRMLAILGREATHG